MNHTKKYHQWAWLLPISAVLIWSLNNVVTKYVIEFINPVSISFYRWLIAFLVLTPFMLPKVWKSQVIWRPHLKQFAVLAAFGMVLYQGLAYVAAQTTTATNMGIVNAFIPIFTIFVSYLILKEQPSRYAIIGSLVSFFGLIYLLTHGQFASLLSLQGHIGDVLMIFAVFFYAFYGVFLKKWQLDITLWISLYIQIGFALLYHLPFVLWLGLDPINHQNVASILYVGIVPSLLAPLIWMLAIQSLGPNRTTIFINLMPIFTAIIAYVWLKEQWTIYHTIGGICILLGIVLAQRKSLEQQRVIPS